MTSADPRSALSHPAENMPVRLGTPEQFARVRRFFHDVGFNDASVCSVLKIPDMSRAIGIGRETLDTASVSPALLAAIDLFVLGIAIPAGDFRAACGEETHAAFAALNLIRETKNSAGAQASAIVCPVWLYPVDGFLAASDRHDDADGGTYRPPGDAVFPALDAGTLKLLRLLPAARGADTLDLCGGCGIGALHFSRTARRAVTADITARSAYFAEFNGRLNAAGIESLRGDLYQPVAGRQFDVIAAHPPWVPSTGDAMVFRDGGEVGEAVIRHIIEGIPNHLRADGTAVIVSLGRDAIEAAYERRVRGWLGEPGNDCDVILGVEKTLTIEDVIGSMRKLHLKDDAEEANRMAARFRSFGTDKFVYGALFIRRTDRPVTEPPLRLRMSSRATAADFERLFSWRMHRRGPGFRDWLMAAKPRLAAHLEVNVRHIVKEGALVAGTATLSAEYAFSTALRSDAWTLPLISGFDGRRSVEQIFNQARKAKQVPGNFTLFRFMDFVALAIEQGFLDIGDQDQ
jgi:SAM-dependent methyltransferase